MTLRRLGELALSIIGDVRWTCCGCVAAIVRVGSRIWASQRASHA